MWCPPARSCCGLETKCRKIWRERTVATPLFYHVPRGDPGTSECDERRDRRPPVNTNKNGKPAVMAGGKHDAYLQSWLFQIDISKVPSRTPSLRTHTYVRRLSRVRLFALSYCQTILQPYLLLSFVMFLGSVSFLILFSSHWFRVSLFLFIFLIFNIF